MKFKTYTAWGVFFFCLFSALSILVFGGFFIGIDLESTVLLQRIIPRSFDLPFSVLSLIGSFEITTLVLFVIFIKLLKVRQFIAVCGLSLFVFGHVIELVGKTFLFHPAPPYTLFRGVGLIEPNLYIHTNYSYPSGHMLRTAYLVVLLIFFVNIKIIKVRNNYFSAFLVVFLALMIVSRIYLAEHWLSDVLGGLFLGLSFGLLSSAFIYLDKIRSVK